MNLNRFLSHLCCNVLGLAFFLVFTIPASAYDFSSEDKNGTRIFYNINPDGKTVTVTYGGERYNSEAVFIPETVTYEDIKYTVTAIGSKAFEESRIKSISLPNSITEIQQYAFYKSTVSEMDYPTGLKYVRASAFEYANIVNGKLPDGLSVIEESAFNATKIKSLYLPNTLKEIGSSAFHGCPNILEVTIPGSVKVVRQSTFASCANLKKVIIEEGVEELEDAVFMATIAGGGGAIGAIQEIVFPSTLTKIGKYCFRFNRIKNVVIPNTVKDIGEGCFSNSLEMESITFSSSMEIIPDYACCECYKLIKVNIPDGIKKIGNNAFKSTRLLSHVAFPESVVEVGSELFSSSGLVSFTFPKNMTQISRSMFYNCTNLTEIIVPESIGSIGGESFSQCVNLKKVSLPEKLETLGEQAFSGCSSLEEINISSSLDKVKRLTFDDCKSLTKVEIPEGLEEIDSDVFRNCTNLAELKLPKSLKKLGSHFISGCESIREITIYHQTENIAQSAFNDCKNLEKVHLHRAVLPTAHIVTIPNSPVIPSDNNCTLCVPKGSAESYRASNIWNTFKAIEEEEITEELNYQLSFPASISGGRLTVDGGSTKNVMEFTMNSNIVITAESNKGYHLVSLTLNGKDVASEMIDGSYTIEKLDANYVIDAKFAENPVRLAIFTALGGSVDVEVEKRTKFSCFITSEEGWKVNTVTFNNRDVTAELTEDNGYTTPGITEDSELRVTFEELNSAVENIGVDAAATKVYVDKTGLVTIEGVENGAVINAYAVNGQSVGRIVSSGEVARIQLYKHGIYLIQTPVKIYKIHY